MSLYSDFADWQTRLTELVAEGEALAQRVDEAEKQNIILQRQLADSGYTESGFGALSKLYDEGFHICPNSFAQAREEDCLFCLNFLHHKGQKQV